MEKALMFILLVFCCAAISAQNVKMTRSAPVGNELQKLVETELQFARTAAEKGTRSAFLEFLADDGVIFSPTEMNGKLVWKGRPESPALLSWNPAWADISADGKFGYTTGGWEFRPKGKTDKPSGFGEYVTLWQKQPDGTFKAVLDIGIRHPSSSLTNAAWKSPSDAGSGAKTVKAGVSNAMLNDIFSNRSMANGYFNYLADDCVVLREGQMPLYGKQNAFFALEKLDKEFPDSAFLNFSASLSKIYGNLMYASGEYKLNYKDGSVKRWNFVQIWKNRGGRWLIALDIFNPIPEKK